MKNSLRTRLAIIFIGLAVGPLLLVGIVLVQRSFVSERQQAVDLQQQVAQRVSAEIESFLLEVANDLSSLGGALNNLENPDRAQQLSLLLEASNSGPYRQAYEEFALLDSEGQEQLRMSRAETIPADQLQNRAGTPEFEEAKASRQIYLGPVEFDQTSGEPFVTMAFPVYEPRSVQLKNVLVAKMRFKTVGQRISAMGIGGNQTVYVVDPEGKVVAHQDSSIFLPDKSFDLNGQLQSQTGLEGVDAVLGDAEVHHSDQQALTIVAERPAAEALVSAYDTMYTIIITIVIALLIAAGLGFWIINRQIVRPIEILSTTAQAISQGDLSQQVPVTSQDELGQLGNAFNSMTTQLRDLVNTLEDRIKGRTQALETSAEISRQIAAILNLEELLQYVVNRIQTEFGFYHTHIYLVEAESGDLVMAEGSGTVGQQLKAKGHRLLNGQGIVGTVASTNEAFFSSNVDDLLNFVLNPLLPNTKSELAVPLRKGSRVLGVLDIQSDQVGRFTMEDVELMQALANQIAIAIDNARLVTEVQKALQEVERLNRRLTRESWEELEEDVQATGYHYQNGVTSALPATSNVWLPPMEQAATSRQLVRQSQPGNGEKPASEMAVPLMLRGEVIGVLGVKREETADWEDEEVSAVEAVAGQIARALENARLSKEQEKTIEQLQEIDRLKSEFLTSMSHELRTPLNSIIGFADVMLQGIDGELNDMAMNDIRLIHNSGQHLLALINDILDISKIEAGMMELVAEPLDVEETVRDVLAASSSLVKERPVEIVADVLENLPPIYADKLRLHQILLNLVSNSAKFTHEGSITIKARVDEENPDTMMLSIIDTGIGISEDKLETIFDRFQQADSSTTREYGGTGLGLAICRQLVEMHGGQLNVKSKVDQGSEFYFSIPLVEIS